MVDCPGSVVCRRLRGGRRSASRWSAPYSPSRSPVWRSRYRTARRTSSSRARLRSLRPNNPRGHWFSPMPTLGPTRTDSGKPCQRHVPHGYDRDRADSSTSAGLNYSHRRMPARRAQISRSRSRPTFSRCSCFLLEHLARPPLRRSFDRFHCSTLLFIVNTKIALCKAI